jgi:hypothetical protein
MDCRNPVAMDGNIKRCKLSKKLKTSKPVIPAGIAGNQLPWMAILNDANHFLAIGSYFYLIFHIPMPYRATNV